MQRLQFNRLLTGLHSTAAHLSAGRSVPDLLGCIADSLIELLQAERAAVALWEDTPPGIQRALVNLEIERGERLLCLARDCMAAEEPANVPTSLRFNAPDHDPRFAAVPETLVGVHGLLITRFPAHPAGLGVLVACSRQGRSGFTLADQELAELLALHASLCLETAQLQAERRSHSGFDERRRIAAELHDGLRQTVASIDLHALICGDLWHRGEWEPLGEELLLLKGLAEEALEETRGAVTELAPVRLRGEGLMVYLQEYITLFQERAAKPAAVSITLEDRAVPEPAALLLMGLLREGLTNVRKHAGASRVTLEIAPQGNQIVFRLADDGVGFAPERHPLRHPPARHYGLAYLRERLTAAGGALEVSSRPGEGTLLEARVPLRTDLAPISSFSNKPA
jgi:signal transduction histidine kinase